MVVDVVADSRSWLFFILIAVWFMLSCQWLLSLHFYSWWSSCAGAVAAVVEEVADVVVGSGDGNDDGEGDGNDVDVDDCCFCQYDITA